MSKQKNSTTRVSEFQGDMPRRVHKAVPEEFWVNGDGDINGNYIDVRTEIDLPKNE